ncbi:XkdX family protein [Ureibacillus sinduriensis]|nr:XkdX family protein [Ureibacillus sinduriensis]
MSFWELAIEFNWASKANLQRAVQLKEIGPQVYESITGEPYAHNCY